MRAIEALALVSGHVEEELLKRNEYLAAENEILRSKIKGRLRLNDTERIRLAKLGHELGRKALEGVAAIVKPETILSWFRKLVARKFDSFGSPRKPGRPRTPGEIEALIVKMAEENPSWGYSRIVGALSNLGIKRCEETVAEVLRRYGIPPAPQRQPSVPWSEFIRSHQDVLAAADFFTAEVMTSIGLVTYYVLFFLHIDTRRVHIAGITPYPDESWMKQVARNVTMAGWGFLEGRRYVIIDRDSKYAASFREVLKSAGLKIIRLPPYSPNLNAFAERWVLSAKSEVLSRLVIFGESGLRKALAEFLAHYHEERNHLGMDNVVLFPRKDVDDRGEVHCRERLGGLLKFYSRQAA
jgi:transposase InsO family protein